MPIAVYGNEKARLAPIAGVGVEAPRVGFGQEIGQGAARLAGGMANMADMLHQRRLEEAEATALEAMNTARRQQMQLLNEFSQQRGGNAMRSREDFERRNEQIFAEASALAGADPFAQEMFSRQREAEALRGYASINDHANRETFNYRVGQREGSLAISLDAAVGATTDDAFAIGLRQVIADRDALNDLMGLSPEEGDAAGQTQIDTLFATRITRMIEGGDIDGADAFLGDYREAMSPGLAARADGLLESARWEGDLAGLTMAVAQGTWVGDAPAPTESGEAPAFINPLGGELRIRSDSRGDGQYGARRGGGRRQHRGIDYQGSPGDSVVAAAGGRARVRSDPSGYGTYVEIDHGGGRSSIYAHLSGTTIRDGQTVEQGQQIGAVGSSGNAAGTTPHLHYEVRENGQAIDPASVGARRGSGSQPSGRFATRGEAVAAGQAWARERGITDLRRIEQAGEAAGAGWQRQEADVDERRRDAAEAVAPYMPGGANAVGSWEAIPATIRAGLSPSQETNIRNAFLSEQRRAAAEAEGAQRDAFADGRWSDDFVSLVLESRRDPATFARRDRTDFAAFAPSERNALMNAWVDVQSGEAISPVTASRATSAGRFVASTLGIEMEDGAVEGLAAWVIVEADRLSAEQRQTVTDEQLRQIARAGLVNRQEARGGFLGIGPGSPTPTYAMTDEQRGENYRPVIPSGVRERIVRDLRDETAALGLGTRQPLDIEIEQRFLEGRQAGLW